MISSKAIIICLISGQLGQTVPLVSGQLRLQELHDTLLSHLLDDVTGQAVTGRSGLLLLCAT